MEQEPKTNNVWILTAYWRDRALKAEEAMVVATAVKPDPKPYAPPVPGRGYDAGL